MFCADHHTSHFVFSTLLNADCIIAIVFWLFLSSTLYRSYDSQLGCKRGTSAFKSQEHVYLTAASQRLSYLYPCLHLCPKRLARNNSVFTLRQSRKTQTHTVLFRSQIIWKDLEFDSSALCSTTKKGVWTHKHFLSRGF